jgi:1-deoxy-D-xylulose-5-phosphate reductoisomerase
MNKGLELIEASYLFDLKEDKIDVLVHPQSIVHSLVHYRDGSVLAQMACPDMRVPIAFALSWPHRMAVSCERLDLAAAGALTFEAPDLERFPALGLCRAALVAGPAAVTALNAANEVAVAAFLAEETRFLDISRIVEEAVEIVDRTGLIAKTPSSFDEVAVIDQTARAAARSVAARLAAA